jgi:hypothetical protein
MRVAALVAVMTLVALAGCSGRPDDLVRGSDSPPADFGTAETPWRGCASVAGLYAWPPIQGEADDGRDARLGRLLPILLPTGLSLHHEGQIWVDDRSVFRLSSRLVNRDPNRGIRALTTEWGYQEIFNIRCDDGRWAWTAETPDEVELRAGIYGARMANAGAESISGGLQLVPMTDGRLAIGQWERLRFRADGREGPPEAGESRLDPPDRVTWHWSLLERLGDTGEGVPPPDAAINPAFAPATR